MSLASLAHSLCLILCLTHPAVICLSCRWFCEGKELFNSPDIQIHGDGTELHTLVIAEAFEDDTGRYSCLATNPSGSDTTSAEVFIEGKWGVAGGSGSGLLAVLQTSLQSCGCNFPGPTALWWCGSNQTSFLPNNSFITFHSHLTASDT